MRPIAERLERKFPVIVARHESGNWATRGLAARGSVVVFQLNVQRRVVVRGKMGVDVAGAEFIRAATARAKRLHGILFRRKRADQILQWI
jgi:hypothetical protein